MRNRRVEIRCPKCHWKPLPSSRWYCVTSCQRGWNTFDTGGVCPACGKAWRMTQCLSCGAWSPHPDWYREYGGEDAKAKAARPASRPLAVPLPS
jgi:hypothetical protein